MICLDCQSPERPIQARGLCQPCYGRHKRIGDLDRYPLLGRHGDPVPVVEGVTYRQLDYWVRVGYLHPKEPTPGSGFGRVWPDEEVDVARTMARLVRVGLLPAAAHRAARMGGDLGDGVRVTVEAVEGSVG